MLDSFISNLNKQKFNKKEKYILEMVRMFDCYSTDAIDILNYFTQRDMIFKSWNDENIEKVAIIDNITDNILAYFSVTTEFQVDGATMNFSKIIKY